MILSWSVHQSGRQSRVHDPWKGRRGRKVLVAASSGFLMEHKRHKQESEACKVRDPGRFAATGLFPDPLRAPHFSVLSMGLGTS